MAPPPQQPPPTPQAGKFKPRKKPAKKIRVMPGQPEPDGTATATDAAAAAAAVPIAVPSNPSAGRGRGARGGGDGGRGGRGRGRLVVVPQGPAFFTAPPSSSSSGARAKGGTASARRSRASVHRNTAGNQPLSQQQEEIVGTLDDSFMIPDGVGSSAAATKKRAETEPTIKDNNEMSLLEREMMGGGSAGAGDANVDGRFYTEGFFSDSDSSRDDDNSNNTPKLRHHTAHDFKPLEPSFAPKQQPATNEEGSSIFSTSTKNNKDANTNSTRQKPVYMIQFPTRLPPLNEQAAPIDDGTMTVDDNADVVQMVQTDHAQTASTSTAAPARASTAPCDATAFDRVLHGAVTGKIGTLQILKSGKMRLVLAGTSNPTIAMMVHSGLEQSFRQEAIAIDLENTNSAQCKSVGTVEKTFVVTPDLSIM